MPIRSAWLINRTDTTTGQSRTDTRLAPTGTMSPQGLLGSRDGVIPGSPDGQYVMGGLYVFGDTAGMTASVAPGRAVVQSRNEQAGAYPVVLTDYSAVTLADGDANNPRIDLVVVRIYDAQHDSSGRTEAVLEVVPGTPAADPQAPETPAHSLALAEITVPAGASVGTGGIDWANAVADRRRPTVAVGGVIPQSWGDGFDGAYPGQYRDNGAHLERWDGTAWLPYARQLGGVAPEGEVATGQYVGQYRDEGGTLQRWDGAVWQQAAPAAAFAYHNDGGYCETSAWSESVTSTDGPVVTATFTAPASGRVVVTVGFRGRAGASDKQAQVSARIRQSGSGALVLEADDVRAAHVEGTPDIAVSDQFPVTGLEPGTEYTATLTYRSSVQGVSAWFDNRYVRVDPMQ
ncbi:hypothetical protein [Streptomyces sp. JJ36]|uniref:hypothetical protein n=1 Tax=Streptomyces sp. JJ36 TaxID=2736645 RepID=UPI001F249D7D|nr:hypothetical protein [Streptomyces sp. JJ36]MCF6523056.1 hypothetical protein [Streptomyces sp. JJ36]